MIAAHLIASFSKAHLNQVLKHRRSSKDDVGTRNENWYQRLPEFPEIDADVFSLLR